MEKHYSEHKVKLHWQKETESFAYKDYNREHDLIFSDKTIVRASSAPQFMGDPDAVDPEQSYVSAIASCHLLFFIAFCSKKRLSLLDYKDSAIGILEPSEQGALWISKVILTPQVTFAAGEKPENEELERLHAMAHKNCFLANSVKTEVVIEVS
ncbi:MAG: OsmC family protein [Pseudomonadota bacterium]